LYDELFSDDMKLAYRKYRDKVRTMLITSDEPWIPWEMVKPYDDSDARDLIDDDFLCARFKLTRWLAGEATPVARLGVSHLACLVVEEAPGKPRLEFSRREREYFKELQLRKPEIVFSIPEKVGLADVEAVLDKHGIGLIHIAGHGNEDPADPNGSAVFLADGKVLSVRDLSGPRQTSIKRARSMVVLNACGLGKPGWSLMGLGGWASRCISGCHCGAFVGPMWAVDDRLAAEFSAAFYDALFRFDTIAEAALDARTRVRTLAPNDPSWLAYSVYAHPNGRMLFSTAPHVDG
jgi:hypothetical protein